MTPEVQQIAIAEAWGWQSFIGETPIEVDPKYLPKFGDLNIMREVEIAIPENKREEYVYQLTRIACETNYAYEKWKLLHATADQRVEAFLRTLGLWKHI